MPSIAEQIDALEPGVIRVFRDSDHDIGFREALLYLDDEQVGSVDFRHSCEINVRPGTHTLQAFNRIFRSKKLTFDIKPGERISFQTANVGGGCFIFFMMLTMGIPKIHLWREVADSGELRGAKDHARRHVL